MTAANTARLLSLNIDVCNNYKVLSGGDRAQGSVKKGNISCERDRGDVITGWYRFQGAAGDRILDKCVPEGHCSAPAPGWMRGNHPTVAEGVVTREVCFRFSTDCCFGRNNITVKNCGGYFVYMLESPNLCSTRFCGNGRAGELP